MQRSRLVRIGITALGVFTLTAGTAGGARAQSRTQTPTQTPTQRSPQRQPPLPTRVTARTCGDTLRGAARAVVTPPLSWHDGVVAWAEWSVELGPRKVPVTVVVTHLDPTRVALALDIVREDNAMGAWSIERAPAEAVVAFNAGQFDDDGPWGWVVHRGREWQAPGAGSLAAAIVVDTSSRVQIVAADELEQWRSGPRRPSVREAVQSYPHLLRQGRLVPTLCRTGAINTGHRDIRLALGVRPDGTVLVALTRYAPPRLLPDAAQRLPIGPTTLEMAEIMHRLGSVDAVMLDGGLSAQLRVHSGGTDKRWPGLRAVPLAFTGISR